MFFYLASNSDSDVISELVSELLSALVTELASVSWTMSISFPEIADVLANNYS